MRRQQDTIAVMIPEPADLARQADRLTWRGWTAPTYPDDPAARGGATFTAQATRALDDFAAISRGDAVARVASAEALALRWGQPLTLCGICARRHVWDRITPRSRLGWSPRAAGAWRVEGPRLRARGAEPLREWLAWADMINALRRVAAANRAGKPGEPADVARVWYTGPPADPRPAEWSDDWPAELPTDEERRASVAAMKADPMAQRQTVALIVNEWLRETCTAPAMGYPADAPLGSPAEPIVRVGSVLGLLGWALREELTRGSGAIGTCDICSVTFFKERKRVDTDKRKSRTLCEVHDAQRRKREERRKGKGSSDGADEG